MSDQLGHDKLLIELVQSQAEATATLKHLVGRIDEIAQDKNRVHEEMRAQFDKEIAENRKMIHAVAARTDSMEGWRDRAIGWLLGAGIAGGIAGSGLVGLARAVTLGFVGGLFAPPVIHLISLLVPIPKPF